MRILDLDQQPFYDLPYRTAASGGGIMRARLPLLRATVDTLPADLDALFAAADLQGLADQRIDGAVQTSLLGEVLAEELAGLAALGFVPSPQRMGVLLCGDLYVRPGLDARGGLGDVRGVWRAFRRHFRWVAGVAGNHDTFGTAPAEQAAFAAEPDTYLLDGQSVERDGLRIGGLGGIISSKQRPGRRDEKSFTRGVRALLASAPDLLLLHQGPDVPSLGLPGEPRVRAALERTGPLLVLCGHVHWREPLATLGQAIQVLNLEARGVLMTRHA